MEGETDLEAELTKPVKLYVDREREFKLPIIREERLVIANPMLMFGISAIYQAMKAKRIEHLRQRRGSNLKNFINRTRLT
jgi:hypothetical protein